MVSMAVMYYDSGQMNETAQLSVEWVSVYAMHSFLAWFIVYQTEKMYRNKWLLNAY